MKRWVRRFGLLLGAVSTIAFVFYAVHALKGQDLSRYLTRSAIVGIGIAALGYSLIVPVTSVAWRRLLGDMGVRRRWSELAIIMAVTQLAKYIPGNLGQHVGRATMSVARGIPLRPYSVSVVSEMVLAVLAAAGMGFVGCGLAGMDSRTWEGRGSLAIPFIAVLACGFVLAVVFGRRLLPRLLSRLAPDGRGGMPHAVLPRNLSFAFAFGIYLLNYAVFGTGLTIMVTLLLPGGGASWFLLTGAFALAWVIGFFAPGAPAGLGVREALLLALLQFSYSQPDALFVVIAVRLATTVGDVLCFLAGSIAFFLCSRRWGNGAHSLTSGRQSP